MLEGLEDGIFKSSLGSRLYIASWLLRAYDLHLHQVSSDDATLQKGVSVCRCVGIAFAFSGYLALSLLLLNLVSTTC